MRTCLSGPCWRFHASSSPLRSGVDFSPELARKKGALMWHLQTIRSQGPITIPERHRPRIYMCGESWFTSFLPDHHNEIKRECMKSFCLCLKIWALAIEYKLACKLFLNGRGIWWEKKKRESKGKGNKGKLKDSDWNRTLQKEFRSMEADIGAWWQREGDRKERGRKMDKATPLSTC